MRQSTFPRARLTGQRLNAAGRVRVVLGLMALCLVPISVFAQAPVLIGFDGAFAQKTSTSAKAIELGSSIAIEEINQRGGVLGGRPLKLVTADNHGISARARDNFQSLSALTDLVAIYGGKFSPTIIETMPLANELKTISVSLWGSASSITNDPLKNPYVYRLSLKDSWAIPAMMRHAAEAFSAVRLCAVMPSTAWGRSGATVLQANLQAAGQTLVYSLWYNWGQRDFLPSISECRQAGGQAVILIANEAEAAAFVKSMAAVPTADRLPVVGHWGMTGGVLHELVGDQLASVRLDIIQTFTFVDNPRPKAQALAARAIRSTGAINAAHIPSPVGIAQAYDMTHLLKLAIDQAGSTDREAIQAALERLPDYDGAIRNYVKPFSRTNHDALTPAQVVFVNMTASGALVPISGATRPHSSR